jgi:hypothetical protein
MPQNAVCDGMIAGYCAQPGGVGTTLRRREADQTAKSHIDYSSIDTFVSWQRLQPDLPVSADT